MKHKLKLNCEQIKLKKTFISKLKIKKNLSYTHKNKSALLRRLILKFSISIFEIIIKKF